MTTSSGRIVILYIASHLRASNLLTASSLRSLEVLDFADNFSVIFLSDFFLGEWKNGEKVEGTFAEYPTGRVFIARSNDLINLEYLDPALQGSFVCQTSS